MLALRMGETAGAPGAPFIRLRDSGRFKLSVTGAAPPSREPHLAAL